MDSVLIECPIAAKSPNFPLLSTPNYDSMLKESVPRFLSSIRNRTLDLSNFRSVFSRLLQSSSNPPIEAIWFYSAINHHESLSSSINPDDRAVAIKNLVQFLSACSCSCSGMKSIALLAPVIFEIYRCILEEENREIEGLVESILSHISICSGKRFDNEVGDGLLPCFVELVRVWTFGRLGSGSGLEVFFPLVSEEIRRMFEGVGCGIVYLSAVVIVEVFLLRLCLKIRSNEGSRDDLKKELRVWSISSVTAFWNHNFFEILLRLLLDPMLPVMSLLDSKEENLLREILYDVMIFVEYSFVNPGRSVDQSYDFTRRIAFRRLIVTHDAIRIASEKGDHGKAISYMSAFSTSCLPVQIIKWVANQTGMGGAKRPEVNTPQALLEWLVGLEDKGLVFSDDGTLMLRTKVRFHEMKAAPKIPVFNTGNKETDADLFFTDNEGHAAVDEEMRPTDDAAFLADARPMNSHASNGVRKRKDLGGKEEAPSRFIKCKVHESSVKDCLLPSSLVDNPPSDEEMEES